ncbi:MAG: hypothetical protein H6555_08395 [Lewinellaceae bacterium]|nr:hypothetical protein [Lewinellaceae bacterium]
MKASWCTLCLTIVAATFTYGQQPCSLPAYNQFDFWVGEWEVYHPQADTLVGRNTITRTMNGCVVEEHWLGQGGFEGKSFNTYDPRTETWNQVWVDQGGATYHFTGKYADNVMRLEGKTIGQQGQEVWFVMSYTYDASAGTVRQWWQASRDDGATWNTVFDGIYRKKKP